MTEPTRTRLARAARAAFYARFGGEDADPDTFDLCSAETKEDWERAVLAILDELMEPGEEPRDIAAGLTLKASVEGWPKDDWPEILVWQAILTAIKEGK